LEFTAWYEGAYPRKQNRDDAWKAWVQVLAAGATTMEIALATANYDRMIQGTGTGFRETKMPGTFLRLYVKDREEWTGWIDGTLTERILAGRRSGGAEQSAGAVRPARGVGGRETLIGGAAVSDDDAAAADWLGRGREPDGVADGVGAGRA